MKRLALLLLNRRCSLGAPASPLLIVTMPGSEDTGPARDSEIKLIWWRIRLVDV